MPDYKIYIHSYAESGGNGYSPTKPWANQGGGNNETSVFKAAEEALQGAENFATGGFSSVVNKGVAELAGVLPAIALQVASIKITDGILSTGFSHLETYTGHYEYSMNFNNFKTLIGNALNPIGMFLKNKHREAQFNLQNKKIEQERTLVGNSILNMSKRGA